MKYFKELTSILHQVEEDAETVWGVGTDQYGLIMPRHNQLISDTFDKRSAKYLESERIYEPEQVGIYDMHKGARMDRVPFVLTVRYFRQQSNEKLRHLLNPEQLNDKRFRIKHRLINNDGRSKRRLHDALCHIFNMEHTYDFEMESGYTICNNRLTIIKMFDNGGTVIEYPEKEYNEFKKVWAAIESGDYEAD